MNITRASASPGRRGVWKRPGGIYRLFRRDVVAVAGLPFDVERVVLKPGDTNWPYHSHSAWWEVYYIERGAGRVRSPKGWTTVHAGDWITHPPREPHQMKNAGKTDLVYYVIANHARDRTKIHSG